MQLEVIYLWLQGLLAGFAILNAFFWRDLQLISSARKTSGTLLTNETAHRSRRVSVLVPARNEAQNLERLLPSLLQKPDDNLEILVLNDRSEDDTANVVRAFAARDPRVRLLEGAPLPEGWLGKNWACHQLAQGATGEMLIFTDADTKWELGAPQAVARELEGADAQGLAGLCAWPAQTVNDPVSRLIQPLQQWSLVAFLPMFFVPVRAFPIAVAANGQCLAFTRAMYDRVGGHAAVRGDVLEDMALARAVKRRGGRFVLLNGVHAIETRMYSSAREALSGYAKNVYPAFGGTPAAFIGAMVFNLALYVFPWLWLLATWRLEAFLCVVSSLVARGVSDWRCRYDWRWSLLHPVSVLVWAWIGAVSMRRFRQGRVTWKGRSYDLR
jgi:chlorobactene glucosyltransferase